jgi:L-ribulose-5-phosphate 3-epimerase
MCQIGFIQGRLSPIINGKIQAFPWKYWQEEYKIAREIGFHLLEWTLDQERLYENPFMTTEGQSEIKSLCKQYKISIPSLTGDCFMQSPYYKVFGKKRESLLADFNNIIEASHLLGVGFIVFPLVDNGSLQTDADEESLLSGLTQVEPMLFKYGIKIAFESDFPPAKLNDFISKLSSANFGINYDMGNSAALGFDPKEEIRTYGERIFNVHIKDRVLNGTTVPLGHGYADIPMVLKELKTINYNGNYIIQAARAIDNDHAGVLRKYRKQVIEWMN